MAMYFSVLCMNLSQTALLTEILVRAADTGSIMSGKDQYSMFTIVNPRRDFMNYVRSRAGDKIASVRDAPVSSLDTGDNMIAYVYPWELVRGQYCYRR